MSSGDRLAILTYHSLDESGSVVSLSPPRFSEQMARLAQVGFRGISLREALDHRDATGHWPGQAVVITFDDGYANVYEHAWPILSRHGFRATVFLVTGHVGGANDWAPPPRHLGKRRMLSWDQTTEMVEAGIEMGAHTVNHPDLRTLADSQVQRQLVQCQEDIHEHTGQQPETFAYPFGYLSPAVERVAARVFRASCTTVLQRVTTQPLHRLPRLDIFYLQHPSRLQGAVTGKLDGLLAFRRWARSLRASLTRA